MKNLKVYFPKRVCFSSKWKDNYVKFCVIPLILFILKYTEGNCRLVVNTSKHIKLLSIKLDIREKVSY